jgi:DNA-binding CsgD family transcriptional regulator
MALAIFEGAAPREAAAKLGITANTAKVHLTRVFEKTGVNRQAELVTLMMKAVGLRLE